MSQTKHTDCPISVSAYSSVVGVVLSVQPDPKKNSYTIGSAIGPKDEALANARLWATAPAMLNALKEIAHDLAWGATVHNKGTRSDGLFALIAKAEGRE